MNKPDQAPVLRTREDVRRYVREISERRVEDEPAVRRWRLAGRATLSLVLVYTALQYYFLTIFVEIMSLPGIVYFAAPLKSPFG